MCWGGGLGSGCADTRNENEGRKLGHFDEKISIIIIVIIVKFRLAKTTFLGKGWDLVVQKDRKRNRN